MAPVTPGQHPHTSGPIVVRALDGPDFRRLHEIDVSEHITLIYRWADGALRPEAIEANRPRWDRALWQERLNEWRASLQPDAWLGAFAGNQLAGEASVRYELEPGMAQLTTLHVDRGHRRQGIARQLLAAVTEMAEEHGAEQLYVSASETESAVGFYLSQGFRPTSTPNPRLFELEPEDIHMVLRLRLIRPASA